MIPRQTSSIFSLPAGTSFQLDLPVARLIEESMRRGEGILAENGAFVVETGARTGRSPEDKFLVENDITRDTVAWSSLNKPMSVREFTDLLSGATGYLESLEHLYVVNAVAGADARHCLKTRIITERAWHALFSRQLLRRRSLALTDGCQHEWNVLVLPGFDASAAGYGTASEVFIGIDFENEIVLISGTEYAGEIKKAIFTVLNLVLPVQHNVLPMHCSANVGASGDVALFFGLSGTGKTSLSTDPHRFLIGVFGGQKGAHFELKRR